MSNYWPPDQRLPQDEDFGPYPREELEEARNSLIYSLSNNQSDFIERLKPKLGIPGYYGGGRVPPPVRFRSFAAIAPPIHYKREYPSRCAFSSDHHAYWVADPRTATESGQGDSGLKIKPSPEHTLASPSYSDRVPTIPLYRSNESNNISTNSGDNLRPTLPTPSTSGSMRNSPDPVEDSRSTISTVSSIIKFQPGVKRKYSDDDSDGKGSEQKAQRLSVSSASAAESTASFASGSGVVVPRTLVDPTYQTYKCDFCKYHVRDKLSMKKHLLDAKHFSGSRYNVSGENGNITLISIEEMLSVTNQYSKNVALTVTCPKCKDIFEDIFMCGLHYKYYHGSENGFYSISPVVFHQTVAISSSPQCRKCKVTFPNHSILNNHWKSIPEHKPFSEPLDPQVFMIIICPYCTMMFYGNFYSCKSHVLNHKKGDNATYAVEVKHLMLPSLQEELPPFNTERGYDGIKAELNILHNMRKHFNATASSKSKVSKIRERIHFLNRLIRGTKAQVFMIPDEDD